MGPEEDLCVAYGKYTLYWHFFWQDVVRNQEGRPLETDILVYHGNIRR